MNSKAFQGFLVLVLLSVAAFALSHQSYQAYQHGDSLKMWVFDIGQGDAVLFDTPDQHQILIDGGRDNSVLTQLQKALPVSDKTIDLIIVTHDHADHLVGILDVLQHYTVNDIWISGASYDSATYRNFIKIIQEKHIPTETVEIGKTINFGDLHGIALSPFKDWTSITPDNAHDANIVTYWQYGNETILETGDAEQPMEQEMISRGVLKHADILKVGHHGSATSSSESFLQKVSPKLAVISVAKHNKYNLPNPGVIDHYKRLGIPVIQTADRGTIELTITKDGFSY